MLAVKAPWPWRPITRATISLEGNLLTATTKLLACALALVFAAGVVAGCDDDVDLPEDAEILEELPADWPADFPIYPGAELDGVFASTEEGAEGTVANYLTPDSVGDVAAFYRRELGGGRWHAGDEPPLISDDSGLFVFREEGTQRGGTVVISSDDDDETQISILLSTTPVF